MGHEARAFALALLLLVASLALVLVLPSSSLSAHAAQGSCSPDDATECSSEGNDSCDRSLIDATEPGADADPDTASEDCTSDPAALLCTNVADQPASSPAHAYDAGYICGEVEGPPPDCTELSSDDAPRRLCRQLDAHGVHKDRGPPR